MTRHEPQQTRGVVTRNKIIAAAQEFYAEVGRDRFETTTVAARAGVSIGTIYRYFDDRVDLMDAVAPDRDYPSLELLQKAAVEGYHNGGSLPAGTAREVAEFLEDVR